MRRTSLPVAFLLAASAAAVAGRLPEARADAVIDVENGNKIDTQQVQLPPGEDIRIRFVLAKGSSPKLKLALRGAARQKPISFQRSTLFGPDGVAIPISQAMARKVYFQRHSNGLDVIGFRGFVVDKTGPYELVIETNATIPTDVKGSFKIARPKSVSFEGDENARVVSVELKTGDASSVVVQRKSKSDSAPWVDRFTTPPDPIDPDGPPLLDIQPGQKLTKSGSTSNVLGAFVDGVYRFTIGYQPGEEPAGAFKGKLRIVPASANSTVGPFRIINPPGVPLTVRAPDRFTPLDYGQTGCGLGFDGNNRILAASEIGGRIVGNLFDFNAEVPFLPDEVELVGSGDVAAGQSIAGFRVVSGEGNHYVGFSTASGTGLGLVKLRPDLSRDTFLPIVDTATSSTQEFFLAFDKFTVSVGRFRAPDGHTVHLVDAATMIPFDTVEIGGGARPHSRGAGAGFRADPGVFEFYAPDTILFGQPSDIHHQVYSREWAPSIAGDDVPIADPALSETYPTAVVVDQPTGVTIVHYVVPESIATGAGQIHRRLYDATGVEIPGSHVILPLTDRHRPSAVIVGSALFLGSERPSGPLLERYPLLR